MMKHKQGFALPTVLIASVVMLMVLVTAVSATTAIRGALENQRYTELAKSAAEAGVVFAEACLRISENTVTWSDAQPLKPNTNCNGEVQATLSAYINEYDDYRTYFVVNEPQLNGNSEPIEAASEGYVEALRSSTGTAWRVFSGSAVSALTVAGDGTPVGTSIEGYWTTAPEGYLLEDGSAVSRTTYSSLFSVIGTTFGSGDGSTTFNLPSSQGRVQVAVNSSDSNFDALGEKGGENEHTLTVAEMPSHTHSGSRMDGNVNDYLGGSGATYGISSPYNSGAVVLPFLSNTGGSGAHNNLQPYITVNRAIKY
ncbi:hypothetical protein GW930_02155 [Candidatus Saccharibacteria bacterium]|nr:hypothetical protein [Candidatus Saccharibacteria bacterium]